MVNLTLPGVRPQCNVSHYLFSFFSHTRVLECLRTSPTCSVCLLRAETSCRRGTHGHTCPAQGECPLEPARTHTAWRCGITHHTHNKPRSHDTSHVCSMAAVDNITRGIPHTRSRRTLRSANTGASTLQRRAVCARDERPPQGAVDAVCDHAGRLQLQLHTACSRENWGHVRHILSLTRSDAVEAHARVFHFACSHGEAMVVWALLHICGTTRSMVQRVGVQRGFEAACKGGHYEVVEELLELRGDQAVVVGTSPTGALGVACANGHVEVVRLLMARGQLQGSERDIIVRVCSWGSAPLLQAITAHNWDHRGAVWLAAIDDGLLAATVGGHSEVVRELLRMIKHSGTTQARDAVRECFEAACRAGHAGVVSELLNIMRTQHSRYRGTPQQGLYTACKHGAAAVVSVLLRESGVLSVDISASMYRAMHLACGYGREGVLRVLLAHGPIPVEQARTQFQLACERGVVCVVRAMLHGMDADALGVQEGVCVACRCDRREVLRELLHARGVVLDHIPDAVVYAVCRGGRTGIMRQLLRAPEPYALDLDGVGKVALQVACESGHLPMVLLLLSLEGRQFVRVTDSAFAGACVNSRTSVVDALLTLPEHKAPSFVCQEAHLSVCGSVMRSWARSPELWRQCPVHVASLHPTLRVVLKDAVGSALWNCRRSAVLCRTGLRLKARGSVDACALTCSA